MEWMTVKDASELWNISGRRVQILCDNGRVDGATRLGNLWVIPTGTPKPPDGRSANGRKPQAVNPLNKEKE
jgi:hypothetical protein